MCAGCTSVMDQLLFEFLALVVVVWTVGFCQERDLKEDLFEIAVDSQTENIYVGGNNVFKLDKDLNILQNVTLGPCRPEARMCDHHVNVLEIDQTFRQLLVCRTSQCWFLDLRNLTRKRPLSGLSDYIHVNRSKKPIVQVINRQSTAFPNTSNWIVASSYNSAPSNQQSESILSTGKIYNGSDKWNFRITYSLNVRKHISSFEFDFVDGFCLDGECFFLTLQKVNITSNNTISRLARTCAESLFPYVEIPYNNATDGRLMGASRDNYNRALAMTLVQQSHVVISVFGKTSLSTGDVDSKQGFAVSYETLEKLNRSLDATRHLCAKFIVNLPVKIRSPDWYNGHYINCVAGTIQQDRCSSDPTINPVIQNSEGDPVSYFTTVPGDEDIGNVMSVFTHSQPQGQPALDQYMLVFVTTSTGRIYKISFDGYEMTDVTNKTEWVTSLRKAVAVTNQYYYLLSGSKVIRKPTDHCSSIGSCGKCQDVRGCVWCANRSTCQLKAKCQSIDRCRPEIKKFFPVSAPVIGGTLLSLEVDHIRADVTTVTVCGMECPLVRNQTQGRTLVCRIPASANRLERTCDLTVNVSESRINYTAVPAFDTRNSAFTYTIPTVERFTPTRMLLKESGYIDFIGHYLDTGSTSNVTLSRGNHSFRCELSQNNRQANYLRCNVTNVTSEMSSKNWPLHQDCYAVTITIDNFNINVSRLSPFCLCAPSVTSLEPLWTFSSGSVPVTIRGTDLDLPMVYLGLSVLTQQSHETHCEVCEGITNGTCIVCCSPTVLNLTSASANVTAEVWFNMRSNRSQETVEFNSNLSKPFRISVLRDPDLHFINYRNSTACLQVGNAVNELKIEGLDLPKNVTYTVFVDRTVCLKGVFSKNSAILTCSLSSVKSSHFVANASGSRRNDWRNVSRCDARAEEQLLSSEGLDTNIRTIEVLIAGRIFPVGCIKLLESSSQVPAKLHILPVIVGAAGSFVLFVIIAVVVIVVCYKKKQFQKRFLAERSVSSTGPLMHSESGGSSEAGYVSVERLLNPTGDRKKQKEIQESGLIIHRKYLTLGNVIGHGNFGCVFEGHYQTSETDEDSWQMVAVKTLLDPVTHAIDLRGFMDEALLMKNFEHEHVLSLLGVSEGDRCPLVVLPYMERGDLLTYVKDESVVMTTGDVLRFARDIVSGMDYLASNKFVHRDLAARNCMLDNELRVKVADFGLCRDVYEKGYYRSDNKKELPIRWMAMESIEKGTYTSKSDVWSFGVVIWEMTTRGTMPYPGVEGWDILRYLLAGRRLDQPFLCPDALYALMERCWKAQPLERPSFHEIEHDLSALADSLQKPATPTALCVGTYINFPDCRRFRDDAAVVEKVMAAMYKMRQGDATITATSSELSPVSHDASSSSVTDSSLEGKSAEAQEPKFSFTSDSARLSGIKYAQIVNQAVDPLAGKDDGYFMLEELPTVAETRSMRPSKTTTSGASPAVSWYRPQTQVLDTSGKDDGYQYFELEREESSRL